MQNILSLLKLDDKESLIYKTCLQSGELSANEIAQNTGIKRPTAYVILERLKEKGFIIEDSTHATKKFIAATPRQVLTLLKQKKQTFEKQIANWETKIPELEAISAKNFQAPKVKFFRGQESMTKVYEEALGSPVWRGITNIENVEENFEEYLWKIGETLQKNKKDARDIVVDCEIGRAYKKKFENDCLKIKLLPADSPIMTDTIILEDKVFLISFEHHEMLVLDIESPAIAASQLLMFDALWASL